MDLLEDKTLKKGESSLKTLAVSSVGGRGVGWGGWGGGRVYLTVAQGGDGRGAALGRGGGRVRSAGGRAD